MSEEDAKRVETQTIVSRSWAREGLMFAAHPRPGSMNLPVTADARSVSLEGGCALPAIQTVLKRSHSFYQCPPKYFQFDMQSRFCDACRLEPDRSTFQPDTPPAPWTP